MLVLAELTPLDPVTGLRVTLRACSAEDRAITALNGVRWVPAIVETPVLTMKLFDGDFSSDVEVGGASLAVLHNRLLKLDANAGRFVWAGAGIKVWAGNSGDAWPWTQWFEGSVTQFEAKAYRLKLQAKVNTEPFDKDALTARYAGTGGAEGDANLKNKVKPWLFGRALSVEPVPIDPVNNVFQFSAYGPIQAVNNLFERGSDFGASVGDYASYAALIAATIPASRWGTCLAAGLVRLGAPAYGVITGDVDGDKPSGTWIRKTGEIINRIATNAGVSGALIDSASLTALDAAVPYNIGLVLDEQTTVLDIARRLARPCNSQAGLSWLGKLFTTRPAIGTPAITLDVQGRRKPGVIRSTEADVSPPYWRIEMGAQRAWRVHAFDEISSYDPLIDRGAYSSTGWYRAGNLTSDQNMRWRYINATPGAGNAPPTLPTTTNSWWEALEPKLGGIATGATAGRNLVLNPGAESGAVAPWILDQSLVAAAASTGGTLSASTTSPIEGKYSFLSTKGSTAHGAPWIHPAWSVKPGDKYVVRFTLRGSSATGSGLYIEMREKASLPASGYVTYGDTAPGGSTSTLLSNAPVPAANTTYEFTYTVPAGVYFATPTISAWVGAPTGVYFDNVEFYPLSDNELGATAGRSIGFGPPEVAVPYNYPGTTTDILPRDYSWKLYKNVGGVLVEVTTGVTWTYLVTQGTFNGFTSASGSQAMSGGGVGTLTANSLGTSEATILLKALHEGVSTPLAVKFRKDIAAAPAAGGGGGTTTLNSKTGGFSDISSSAAYVDITGTMPVTMPAGKTAVSVSINLDYFPDSGANGSWTLRVKLQRNIAGVWTDVGSPASVTAGAGSIWNTADGGGEYGNLTGAIAETGLTALASYDYRVMGQLTSGTRNHTLTGGAGKGVVITA
jgi:hypothetical protein